MKREPLDELIDILLLAYKNKEWKYVEVAIKGLISIYGANKKGNKKLKKKLENMQIENHNLSNKLKGFDE